MRRTTLRLFLVASLACASGCRAEPHSSAAAASAATTPSTVLRGTHTAIRGERLLVVRTADDWEDLWREHTSAQIPGAPAPAVDFGARMVVGVVLATCPSGGYSVEIRRVERAGAGWRVVAHREAPPPGSLQAAVLTKPFHFVALPRSDAPVGFAWE